MRQLLFLACLVPGMRVVDVAQTTVAPRHKAISRSTPINEISFRLMLPGLWLAESTTDATRRSYYSEAKTEQLTVSIFGSLFGNDRAMKHDERVALFKRMVEKRRRVENKAEGSAGVTLSDPTYAEMHDTLAAKYGGYDSANKRRLHCLVLASSSAFEIFYYEGLNLSEQRAEERAKAIFNSVVIPN